MKILGFLGALALFLPSVAAADAVEARDYVASIRSSVELQAFLDRTVADLVARDPAAGRADLRVALLDLAHGESPRLAHLDGRTPIYPASVIKFVYLMAAFAWQEQGKLQIDAKLDAELRQMVYKSSNRATQRVFSRLTNTQPGPELDAAAYTLFRQRRLLVDDWLSTLGITDLHCVNPTYDGGGDLFGRDRQFLRDQTVDCPLPQSGDGFSNRNAMTAAGTAALLALLATDRALTPADSMDVRRRMQRHVAKQGYLVHRIAGGAERLPGLEVYGKTGTWGPIYADAGIVRHSSDRQFVVVVFTRGTPGYRGDFIADLTYRSAAHLFGSSP